MRIRRTHTLMSGLLVVPASVGLASATAQAAPAEAAASSVSIYAGNAYGTFAAAGKTAVAGRSAVVTLCTSKAGARKSNTVASAGAANVFQTGAINTTASSRRSQTERSSRTTADVHDLTLLSSLITASEVKATSTTTYDSSGFSVYGGGAFSRLRIDGKRISSHAAPNTTIRLRGVGRVVLNEQKGQIGSASASLTVNMLHVYVTQDLTGVAKGTQIIVAHATSSLSVDVAGTLDGMAYGSKVYDNDHVAAGPSARIVLGCGGTDGELKTNSVAAVDVPGLIATGTVTNTARGTITSASAVAETTSRVQNANLLAGLVTADSIRADAHASKAGGAITLSGGGSRFAKLVVAGQAISGHVAPNTKIMVGNLAIFLHRVIKHSNSVEIRMVEIVVHGANPFGLVRGTHIQTAVAEASAH